MIEQREQEPQAGSGLGRPIAISLGGAAALYLVYALAVTILNHYSPPLPPFAWAIIGALSTIVYLYIIVAAIRLLSRLSLSARQDAALFAVSLVLFLALNPLVWQLVDLLRKGASFWEMFSSLSAEEMPPILSILGILGIIVPFFLICAGTFFGRLIANVIRERAILLPVALISGMIDLWGVYWGPVSAMSESAPAAVSGIGSAATVSASVPQVAVDHLSGPLAILAQITPPDTIGIGDFVFLALFMTCAYKLGFSARRTMWGIFTGLLLASTIMSFDGLTLFGHDFTIDYLPGLLFICGGVVLFNLRTWKLSRQEWAMTGVLVAILAGLIGWGIVRAEMAEPRTETAEYTLATPELRPVITEVLKRMGTREKTPAQVIPLYVECVYAIKPDGASAVQWKIAALTRRREVTERSSWEVRVMGRAQPENKGWQIQQQANNPPYNINEFIATNDKKVEPLALLRQAKGLPPAAFDLLDHADQYARLMPGSKLFAIRLAPTGGMLISDKGKVVKKFSYQL